MCVVRLLAEISTVGAARHVQRCRIQYGRKGLRNFSLLWISFGLANNIILSDYVYTVLVIPLMKILGSKRLDLVLEVHCSVLRKSSTIPDSHSSPSFGLATYNHGVPYHEAKYTAVHMQPQRCGGTDEATTRVD